MCLTFSVFAKCTWRLWKWHTDTDAEYTDEIGKLQLKFDCRFQDFRYVESGINVFNSLRNWCWISVNRCPNGTVVLNRGSMPPKGNNFQGAWALMCFRTWKFWSINLPINTFAFTAYLNSRGLETKDNSHKGAW